MAVCAVLMNSTKCQMQHEASFMKSWYVWSSITIQLVETYLQEQQTVSIAKAGIITTLNARTSILAAANPVGSKYDVDLPITRNIDLPPTLISRFDLLYLVLDQVEESHDRKLAQHLVGLYLEDNPVNEGPDFLVSTNNSHRYDPPLTLVPSLYLTFPHTSITPGRKYILLSRRKQALN